MEPIFDKVEDFAMEFYSDGRGKLLFVGYSRFVTDDKGLIVVISLLQMGKWRNGFSNMCPLKHLCAYAI